jgi:putative acetyltransferase
MDIIREMTRFTIGRTSSSDVERVVFLREEVAGEDRWFGEASPDQREEVVARIVSGSDDPNVASFVARSGGEVVASLGITSTAGLAALGMFVQRDHRGRGLGGALLDTAVEWARSSDCHKVILEVWPHNLPARSLYLSRGFVDEGYRRRHHRRRDGTLWDSIDMGLVLDTTAPGCPYTLSDPGR